MRLQWVVYMVVWFNQGMTCLGDLVLMRKTILRRPLCPLPRLTSTYDEFSHRLLCMCMSCLQVGSPMVLGRVGFGKSDVVCLIDIEGGDMLKGRSGDYLCPKRE